MSMLIVGVLMIAVLSVTAYAVGYCDGRDDAARGHVVPFRRKA